MFILDTHNAVLPGQDLFTVLGLVTLATNSQASFKKHNRGGLSDF